MDTFGTIKTRRSIRKYEKKPVRKKSLLKALEAARLAPSADNLQPWSFIVVTDPEIKKGLGSAYNEKEKDWIVSAPVIIVACAFPEKGWVREDGEEYWIVDIAIAMQNLILTAWEEGLGTCWIGDFNEEKVKRILEIPPNVRVVAMTPLGYPAEDKGAVTNRKPLEEIVHYERWHSNTRN